ncbi:hypothetical protein JCM11491_003457 [Sporobolomyces phaffii]
MGFGPSRRTRALVLLTVQNSSVSLLTRHSLDHAAYSPAVAVLSTELVKAAISLAVLLLASEERTEGSVSRRVRVGSALADGPALLALAVPAALYSVQNTLLYTALSNLSAEVYQTTYQLKLVTTAVFSIALFRTRVSPTKWCALVLLTLGVAIVQLSSASHPPSPPRRQGTGAEEDPAKGFVAIFLACVSSGLAGAWFEKILKSDPAAPRSSPSTTTTTRAGGERETGAAPLRRSPPPPGPSLWERNVQLAVPSIGFAILGVCLSSSSSPSSSSLLSPSSFSTWRLNPLGWWTGFTPIVWFVVLNQALGGLLVALVVKEASSIDKGFATSCAIVLSTVAGAVLDVEQDGPVAGASRAVPSRGFVTGAALVVGSTVLYSL